MGKRKFEINNKFKAIISLVAAICFIAAVYFMGGIWFENNDDVFISELLSGKITGAPEFRCKYVGTLITWPLSLLYRVLPMVPWWGIFLFLILTAVVWINVYCAMRQAASWCSLIAFSIIEMSMIVAGIHCFGQAQYTCIAMLLAFSGYVILAGADSKKGSWIAFIICEFLSCNIRDSSMALIQPVGFMMYVGMTLADSSEHERRFKATVKKATQVVIVAICSLAVVKVIDMATFAGKDWKAYYRYNEARTYMTDYEPRIPYDKLEDIFGKYGISQNEYENAVEFRTDYLDYKFTEDCVNELLPRLKELRKDKLDFARLTEATKQLLFTSTEFWHLHQFVAVFFVLLIMGALLAGRFKMIIPPVMAFLGYFVGVVYLAYRDRFVLRVMMPYYLGTLLLLVVILINLLKNLQWKALKDKAAALVLGLLAIGASAYALQIGRVEFAYLRVQNSVVNGTYYREQKDIMDYCLNNPDSHYVLDMNCAKYVSTNIFDSKYYGRANHIYSGSWYSDTPVMRYYCKDYISDNCYYLVYEAQEYRGREGVSFYEELFDSTAVVEDKFKISSGATIWVYRLR